MKVLHLRLPIVLLIVVITYCSMLVPPAWCHSPIEEDSGSLSPHVEPDTQQSTPSGAGLKTASIAATILYLPFKAAFAIAGVLVGGLAYVFSGFNEPTAKNIWIPSTLGTYVITPEHLTGDRAVRFLGAAAESEGMPTTPAAIHD